MIVFASGTNRVADICGAEDAGVPIGVDVSRLSEAAIDELLAGRLPLLLDSGAFSEVSIRNGQIHVTSEISDHEWRRRIAVYLRIAKQRCPERSSQPVIAPVTAVAPDMVGSQERTLERLSKFRIEMREVHQTGAEILVVLQGGSLDLSDFYRKARDVLGFELVPGFPMKKAATRIADILRFLESTPVKRVHLLGIGADNSKAGSLLRIVQHACPGIQISMDSNRIRAAVGARRIITLREIHYSDEMISGWTGEVDLRQWHGGLRDMTEAIFQPSTWLKGRSLQDVADSLTWLPEVQRNDFLTNPDAFVNCDDNLNDWLYGILMQAYLAHVERQIRRSARTRAVAETLGASKIGGQTFQGF